MDEGVGDAEFLDAAVHVAALGRSAPGVRV
jgi:hypothetical protein